MTLRIALVGLAVAALLAAGAVLLLRQPGTGVLVEAPRVVVTEEVPGDALVFMTLRNTGTESDVLIGAVSDLAGNCGFHGPTVGSDGSGGAFVTVPAGAETLLGPETAHIEMLGVARDLAVGDLVPITLVFQNAGEVEIKARVDAKVARSDLIRQAGLYEPVAGEPMPEITVSAEPLEDNRWRIALDLKNFEFDEAAVDTPHQPGRGHAHLYIDNVKIGRLYAPVFETEPLEPGTHQIAITLNTNDHRAYARDGAPITATTEIYQCMCGDWETKQ